MKLSDFIQETLYEIALGVQLGALRAKDFVAISPSLLNGQPVGEKGYVEFDVQVVVGDSSTSTKGGKGQLGAEIQVAAVGKLSASAGGNAGATQAITSERTHHVTFKVPIYMAANFRGNPATAKEAEEFLTAHAATTRE